MADDISYVMDENYLDPFQRRKKQRLEAIREMLKKLEKVDLKTFVAKVGAKNGINEKTMRKYLAVLEGAGEIKISDGTITAL